MYQNNLWSETYSSPLSYKDIVSLAQFFQIVFNHFRSCKSSLEKGYIENIDTISDWYTLTLVERKFISINDERLNIFRRYWNLKESPDALEKLFSNDSGND